jgi:hypothetical protein
VTTSSPRSPAARTSRAPGQGTRATKYHRTRTSQFEVQTAVAVSRDPCPARTVSIRAYHPCSLCSVVWPHGGLIVLRGSHHDSACRPRSTSDQVDRVVSRKQALLLSSWNTFEHSQKSKNFSCRRVMSSKVPLPPVPWATTTYGIRPPPCSVHHRRRVRSALRASLDRVHACAVIVQIKCILCTAGPSPVAVDWRGGSLLAPWTQDHSNPPG